MTRRPTLELPKDAFVLTTSIPDDAAAKRRSRGTLIALLLLLAFLGAATWWVYRSAERFVEIKHAPAASSSTATPATTTP
jgi:hypothetical protein